ncbi:hypothetical protein [Moorena producens]|uniref:hypothetical protein n=1 Tax=Moorena producens TaxID=1155739 RepID=UPI0011EA6A54|nr:hypothetical protein [Moorena producens]
MNDLPKRLIINSLPDSQHPTPHTLLPTPDSQHPTPHTLIPTPHTPHPTPYSLKILYHPF